MKLVDTQIAKMGPQMQVNLCFQASREQIVLSFIRNVQKAQRFAPSVYS